MVPNANSPKAQIALTTYLIEVTLKLVNSYDLSAFAPAPSAAHYIALVGVILQ
jgi:hypothetical protein